MTTPDGLNRAARRRLTKGLARILGIGGIKGGIGKTTTAMFLALVYALLDFKVLVIDADPGSGTARKWYREHKRRTRLHLLPFDVKVHTGDDLDDHITDEGWREEFDLIIIDTGGDHERILKAAARIADYMLLTCSPSPADLMSLSDTARAAIDALSEAAEVRLLLVGVKSERTMKNAKDELRAAGLPVMAATVPHSLKYQAAVLQMPEKGLAYTRVQHELDNPEESPKEDTAA